MTFAERSYDVSQLASLVNEYPDIYWLVQGPEVGASRNIFGQFTERGTALVRQFSALKDNAPWKEFKTFLADNADKIAQIRAADPLLGRAFDILNLKQNLFTLENTSWLANSDFGVYFGGIEAGDWWKAVTYLTNGVLAQAVMEQDVKTTSYFEQSKLDQVKLNLEGLMTACDAERFGEMGKAQLWTGVETPINPFLNKVRELASRTRSK